MIILCIFFFFILFIRRNSEEILEKIKERNNLNMYDASNKYNDIYDTPIYETPIYKEWESTEEGDLKNVEYIELLDADINESEYLDMNIQNIKIECL